MKRLIKKVVLIAVMVTGLVVKANENLPKVIVSDSNPKMVQFSFNNFDGELRILVKDMDKVVLHSEKFIGSVYSKKYDLTNLPNGVYDVEINGETKIKSIPFKVTNQNVEFDYDNSKVYFKPIVVVKKKKVKITKLSLNFEPMTVKVFNKNSQLIFQEVLSGKMDLKRSLELSNLSKGAYTIALITEGKTYIEYIKL